MQINFFLNTYQKDIQLENDFYIILIIIKAMSKI